MSFLGDVNRIYMTNAAEKVIFDTSKPMPHILQTVTQTVTVDFPEVPYEPKENWVTFPNHSSCAYQQQEYQCNTETVCGYVQVCSWQNNQYVCRNEYQCNPQTVCRWVWVTHYGDYTQGAQGYRYNALEWANEIVLANVIGGVEADFLIAKAVATRIQQGNLNEFGSIPCGVPLATTFMANNSSIIETTSQIDNGNPWLIRAMHLFVTGGQLRVRFVHSNRMYEELSQYTYSSCSGRYSGTWIPSMPPRPVSQSRYSIVLNVQVGKFTRV